MTKVGTYVSALRITCPSCEQTLPGNNFRGNRSKTAVCRECEARHPDLRWCVAHAEWLPESDFYRVGVDQKFATNRCRPCRVLFTHGVDEKFMRELTGDPTPRCGACGFSGARLSVDHDHGHCPGERGCRHCVRGYLCQPCNTAEGLLRTVGRAQSLASYMERTRLSDEALAGLPPSGRAGKKRDRRVPGAARRYHEHDAP